MTKWLTLEEHRTVFFYLDGIDKRLGYSKMYTWHRKDNKTTAMPGDLGF